MDSIVPKMVVSVKTQSSTTQATHAQELTSPERMKKMYHHRWPRAAVPKNAAAHRRNRVGGVMSGAMALPLHSSR